MGFFRWEIYGHGRGQYGDLYTVELYRGDSALLAMYAFLRKRKRHERVTIEYRGND